MAISAPEFPAARDEHSSFLNVGRIAVFLGVELDDALIEFACE